MDSYLILVDHECQFARDGGRWFIYQGEEPPNLGTMPKGLNPLQQHRCKKGDYSEACEDDPDCHLSTILGVLPYTVKVARQLKAQELGGNKESRLVGTL